MPGGGWVAAQEADDLLRCYGIPMVEFRRAGDTGAAVEAAERLGGHVVIKAIVPGLLHKTAAASGTSASPRPTSVRSATPCSACPASPTTLPPSPRSTS